MTFSDKKMLIVNATEVNRITKNLHTQSKIILIICFLKCLEKYQIYKGMEELSSSY